MSECTVGEFFPAWATYCQASGCCPYEGFRTLMDWGVCVTAKHADGKAIAFHVADVRVAFIRARKIATKSGGDGLSATSVTVLDRDNGSVPLADFQLTRENVLGVFAKKRIADFHPAVWRPSRLDLSSPVSAGSSN